MKKYTQLGTACIVATVLSLVVLGALLFKTGVSGKTESVVLCLTCILMLVVLLTFYKQEITLNETSISFKFGIGWFGKSYRFSEIESCEAVKNPILVGIGIRYLGNGWLYNVSGLKAIELRFKNKKSIVRIGTDQPEKIAKEVMRLSKGIAH